MSACLFCRIAAGEIPCVRVHESKHLLAFMDINPLSDKHVLVIPKKHATHVDELDDGAAGELGVVLRDVSRAIGAERKFKFITKFLLGKLINGIYG